MTLTKVIIKVVTLSNSAYFNVALEHQTQCNAHLLYIVLDHQIITLFS